jgi:hypothetical protein
MSIRIKTVAFPAVLRLGVIGFASAQENSTSKSTNHNSTRALTGCLQKGDDEYVLLADDGRTWELKGNSVKPYEWSNNDVLWITSVILFTFWLLGILVSHTFGGYLHILVGLTLVLTTIQFIRRWNDLAHLKPM